MMDVLWLDCFSTPLDRCHVGDTIAALSRLAQNGEFIAPGLVVPVTKLTDFLTQIGDDHPMVRDLLDRSLRFGGGNYRVLHHLAQQIRQLIQTTPLPDDLKQSLDHSLPRLASPVVRLSPSLVYGPHQGFSVEQMWRSPSVPNQTHTVIATIQDLWGELFAARNLFYWQQQGVVIADLHLAILIQPVVAAKASGRLIIQEAGWALEAIHGLPHPEGLPAPAPDHYRGPWHSEEFSHWREGSQHHAYYLNRELEEERPATILTVPLTDVLEAVLTPSEVLELQALAQRCYDQGDRHHVLAWQWYDTLPQVTHYHHQETPLAIPLPSGLPSPTVNPWLTGVSAARGTVQGPVFCIPQPHANPAQFPTGAIWVAADFAPPWLPHLYRAGGLILEQAQMTSHGALMARELGIPALVGVVGAVRSLQGVASVYLDGNQGVVLEDAPLTPEPTPVTPITGPGLTLTQVWVNLSQPQTFNPQIPLSVDGVGLLRSELMILPLLQTAPEPTPTPLLWWLAHPQQLVAQLVEWLRPVVAAMAPRPVFYRSTDWRSSDFPPLPNLPRGGTNPALGLRGTAVYGYNSSLFDSELRALQQLHGEYGNLRLILPFVRSVTEWQTARDRIAAMGLLTTEDFQLWLMAEVPSVLFQLPDYAAVGVQGVAIGPRDFAQLLLGVEPSSGVLTAMALDDHPALWAALESLIQTANDLNLPTSLCSSTLHLSPTNLERLIAAGIMAISVERDTVVSIRQDILAVEQRLLRASLARGKRKEERE